MNWPWLSGRGWSLLGDPVSITSFQPVLHNWCNKGHENKDPLLLIRKSSPWSGRNRVLLSEWSITEVKTNQQLSFNSAQNRCSFVFCWGFFLWFHVFRYEICFTGTSCGTLNRQNWQCTPTHNTHACMHTHTHTHTSTINCKLQLRWGFYTQLNLQLALLLLIMHGANYALQMEKKFWIARNKQG